VTKAAKPPATVADFFAALDSPLKPAIRATCNAIGAASPKISEGIKWNAPSYFVGADQYFATVNLHPRGKPTEHVMVVLHRGAKVKKGSVTVDDPSELIEWLSPDRGAVRFKTLAEARKHASALKAIVRQWITQL